MGKHIVLVGGGHAHMTVMINTDVIHSHGHQLTLVTPSAYHYYSGMGPGMLAGTYSPGEIRFNVKKMVEDRGGSFIQDKVIKVDPDEKTLLLDSGTKLSYDVASFNVGSDVPDQGIETSGENIFPVKPIINLLEAQQQILHGPGDRTVRILVVGGGAAGAEVAGNAHRLAMKGGLKAEITLVAGTRLLRRFPEKARESALDSFRQRSIRLIEGCRTETVRQGEALLDNGKTIAFDFAFLALGVRPPALFRNSGIPADDEGGMLVNRHLQSVAHPDLFGGGDCISLKGQPLEKVGVYAVRENPVLYHNLLASAEGRELTTFDPGGIYLLIFNLGDGRGIFWRGTWVWTGKLAFVIKDYIDNRFMKKFQVSGEREEV